MSKYFYFLIAVVVVYLNFILIDISGFQYWELPLFFIFVSYFWTSKKNVILITLLTGALIDLHYFSFGQHLALNLVTIGLLFFLSTFLLDASTKKTNVILFFITTLFYYLLLWLSTGLVIGYNSVPAFGLYLLATSIVSIIMAVLVTIIKAIYDYFKPELKHEEKSL